MKWHYLSTQNKTKKPKKNNNNNNKLLKHESIK